jgi:3-phosphoshikimate 1-carboxyvinyltransferase
MTSTARDIARFDAPLDARVRPPGSKSETVRALAAASLADGRSHLYAPLLAEDPAAMAESLRGLGISIETGAEPWTVDGQGGRLSPAGRPIDANESGLSARILLAIAGSLDGMTVVVGRGRLPERPMSGVVDALRSQGVEVRGDRLPIEVTGRGRLWGGRVAVDCSESSQFATAMMLVAPIMHEPCSLELEGLTGSADYLEGTASIMRRFGASIERTTTGFEIANRGYEASDIVIEPDASSAVYPMAMAAITRGRVVIEGLGESSWQPDLRVAAVLADMGCRVDWDPESVTVDARGVELSGVDVDMSDAPDGALAVSVVALFATGPSRISGLHSLRLKESDRLSAISEEITRVGGGADIDGDTLIVAPRDLHGAVIDPHGDHRIAMAMATAGSGVAGIQIADSHVVNKTWPGFWVFLDTLARA